MNNKENFDLANKNDNNSFIDNNFKLMQNKIIDKIDSVSSNTNPIRTPLKNKVLNTLNSNILKTKTPLGENFVCSKNSNNFDLKKSQKIIEKQNKLTNLITLNKSEKNLVSSNIQKENINHSEIKDKQVENNILLHDKNFHLVNNINYSNENSPRLNNKEK